MCPIPQGCFADATIALAKIIVTLFTGACFAASMSLPMGG
jgi:hypothetical protein